MTIPYGYYPFALPAKNGTAEKTIAKADSDKQLLALKTFERELGTAKRALPIVPLKALYQRAESVVYFKGRCEAQWQCNIL